jgi:selenoprotein W-related protein
LNSIIMETTENIDHSSYFKGLGGKPTIQIEYCPKCGWMLRAAYMAQELLTTFTDDVHGVLLQPSEVSGTYIIRVNDAVIFDRREAGRFPEVKELKQFVRDVVAPYKSLGHSDKK